MGGDEVSAPQTSRRYSSQFVSSRPMTPSGVTVLLYLNRSRMLSIFDKTSAAGTAVMNLVERFTTSLNVGTWGLLLRR